MVEDLFQIWDHTSNTTYKMINLYVYVQTHKQELEWKQ